MNIKVWYSICCCPDGMALYKEVSLPFLPPIGTDVWLPEETTDDAPTCFPAEVVGYEHWPETYPDVFLVMLEQRGEQRVEDDKVLAALQAHGWVRDRRDGLVE